MLSIYRYNELKPNTSIHQISTLQHIHTVDPIHEIKEKKEYSMLNVNFHFMLKCITYGEYHTLQYNARCQWHTPMCSAALHCAGRDLYCASPAVTRSLRICDLIDVRRTPPPTLFSSDTRLSSDTEDPDWT